MDVYTTLILLLLLPLLHLIRKNIKTDKQKKSNLPPSPPKLPIIGNLHQLGTLPHQTLWKLSQKYGPVMLLHLGRVPTIVVSSAEAARQVLKIHDQHCCSRPRLTGWGRLSYNFLDVAFAPYSNYWKDMRKICVLELYSVKRLQSFSFVIEEEIAFLVDCISETPMLVELNKKLLAMTSKIVCRIAFGKSVQGSDYDEGRLQQIIKEAENLLGSFYTNDFIPYAGWIVDRLRGLHRRLEKSFHILDAIYQQFIDEHLETTNIKGKEEDLIDVLLQLDGNQTDHSTVQLTHVHIKAILMDIFLAASTSAFTLVWAMAELARNPRVKKKAQDDIRNCIGNKPRVTEEDIDKLKYLKLVVKETLRLHPPGPLLIPREAISHFKIDGYDIYPKTQINVNVWAIGRDPKTWNNPEEFIPERFEDSSIDFRGQHFEFLPFGSGRRSCPGMRMGLAMIELTLANLLYCFDWKLPYGMKEEDMNMEEAIGLVIDKKYPLELVPIKYEWP